MKNVAVVGAGIAGSLLVYQLIRKGHEVTVFERDNKQQSCSYTAAGMLTPMTELEVSGNGVFIHGMRSLKLWPEIISQLKYEYGLPVYYDNSGTLVIHHYQDQGSFQQFSDAIKSKLSSDCSDYFKQVRISDYEPELTGFENGMYLSTEAHVDSHQLLNALKQVIEKKATWIHANVNIIEPHSLTYEGQTKLQTFDWIFDCRGLTAKKDIEGLHGVRGERICVHAPQVKLKHMLRLMHPSYRLYIVPRQDDHYVIGATEIESSDDGPISVRSALELLSALYSVHKGFAEARIVDIRTGLRPTCLDHQPVVDTQTGLTRINGFYRHGYLLAPAMVEKALLALPKEFVNLNMEAET